MIFDEWDFYQVSAAGLERSPVPVPKEHKYSFIRPVKGLYKYSECHMLVC